MTPTERRDEIAEVLVSPEHAPMETHDPRDGSCVECPWPLHRLDPDKIADALVPRIEEWLADAWDEGWNAMGNEALTPTLASLNPYRKATP